MELKLPEHYDPRLTIRETQDAIKYIRDTFQKELGREMNLERISAPLFVEHSSGLNDNLNGTERPVASICRNCRVKLWKWFIPWPNGREWLLRNMAFSQERASTPT